MHAFPKHFRQVTQSHPASGSIKVIAQTLDGTGRFALPETNMEAENGHLEGQFPLQTVQGIFHFHLSSIEVIRLRSTPWV